MIDKSAAGGTKAPLIFDWLMWLSMPNVYAEWENPKKQKYISTVCQCMQCGYFSLMTT